jgi:predicted anti-sigma-YlaC factor YlaD
MLHQPFDKWLLDEETITFEQRRELEAHLLTCGQCQQLSGNWAGVNGLIKSVAPAAPKAGFTQRWKVTQAERRTSQQPRQVRMFFLTLLVASLASLALLVLFFVLSQVSLSHVLVSSTHFFTSFYAFWIEVQAFLSANLNGPLSWLVWVIFTSGMSILVILWFVTVQRVTSRGAQNV